jgi:predicted translin family RNA/ssDNA-binding protein
VATTLFDRLREEMDLISGEYERDFAGQNRATRDPAQLDDLVRRTGEVLKRIDEIPLAAQGPQLASLREVVSGSKGVYETERKAVVDAKNQGPEFPEFGRLATSANFVFARYARHFAGQNRGTRDVGVLSEMIEDLKQIKTRMQAVAGKKKNDTYARDLEVVSGNMAMYTSELLEIQKVQKDGTQEEQASMFASLANDQFNVYRSNFAGFSRVTRRPQLLQRAIDNLKRCQSGMKALAAAGFVNEHNPKNIEIVQQNLSLYETELVEIRKARQATSMVDLMGELGGAANELFEKYRESFAGKTRTTVDPDLLSGICDRLGEIYRQMSDLARAEKNEMNENNMNIVSDQLAMYEQEWEAVKTAQKK